MKNLKRALSLVLSTAMLVGMMVVGTGAAELKDIKGHDNQEACELMAMIGVMEGDGENFNPDKVVTRNEMAVVMSNLLDLKLNGDHPFTDVAAWADDYVAAIYTHGYTAGKSATTFGGSDKITTAEAALMIMKTLGYFEFQGEFGSDWKLATIKQATKLELLEDVNAGINEYLTRGEVAVMVMNALNKMVVVAEEFGGMSVEGNGISVTEKPNYGYTPVELLKDKLFEGTLTVNEKYVDGNTTTEDAFGRPATTWTYTGGTKASESVTVAKEPTIVITASKNANDMEKILKDYNHTAAVESVEDGADQGNAINTFAEYAGLTGNGKRVEIFTNKQSVVTDIVVVNEYVDKIILVTDANEEKGIERSVTISGYNAYETEDFAKKDWVKFTKVGSDIKSMVPAETVEGKVTAEATGFIKIDGVTYKPNANYATLASDIDLGDNVIVFVDSYGFILGLKEKVSADADLSDYVLVEAVDTEFNDTKAKVIYADGTKAVLTVDTDGVSITDPGSIGQMYTVKATDDGYKFSNLVTTVEADGEYAGYDFYTTTGLTYNKDNGTLGTYRIADDAAIFYLNTANSTYKVMTGAELKKLDEASFTSASFLYANKDASGFKYAELAFVTVSATTGTGDLLYGYVTADTETVKNADDTTVDSITFWNGAETVVALAPASGTGLAKGEFFSYKLNAKGEITNITELSAQFAVAATDGKKVELTDNSISAVYDITDDSVIIYVNVEDKAGVAAGEVVVADKTADETAYILNVVADIKVDANGDDDVNVLFVDVKNDVANAIQ